MLPATHKPESFAQSLARRCLTQELPMQVLSEGPARREIAALAPHLTSLATGFDVTAEGSKHALRAQQLLLADDVLALFPGDGAMEHVSAQISAKIAGDGAQPQRVRER